MPFVLITIGVVLFVTALNGTTKQFGSQLYNDLFVSNSGNSQGQGQGYKPSFIVWIAALMIVGLIGYIPELKKVADMMMALIIVVMVVSQQGFGTVIFQELANAVQQGPTPPTTAAPLSAIPVQVGGTSAPSSNVLSAATSKS